MIAETSGDGTLGRKYIYAGSKRLAMVDNNGYVFYYLDDHLGSTRLLVKEDGTIQDKYSRYLAFGADGGSSVVVDQKYRYTGKPFDEDGGIDIYYYGARYYDPLVGRFLAVDPMNKEYPAWNGYAYVRNNPILRIDPSGLTDITITIQRTTETSKSTIGTFIVTNSGDESTVKGFTLELPANNNIEFKSRVNSGTYSAETYESSKYNTTAIMLEDKNKRTDIAIHPGNKPENTTGCILPGKSAGKNHVNNSRKALSETTSYIKNIKEKDKKNGETTTIVVIIKDPEPPKKADEEKKGDTN